MYNYINKTLQVRKGYVMNVSYGLNSESKSARLFKTALWFIGFYMIKLLANNAVGFLLGSEYVIATRQSDIPKVSSTVSALCGDAPFFGFLLNIGNFAMQFLYPAAMAFMFLWLGWKIAAWLPIAGYMAAAAVYYTVGVQSIEGNTKGLNGLPLYILIPFIGIIVSVVIQLVLNKVKHGSWLHSYVEPCFDPKKYEELKAQSEKSEE